MATEFPELGEHCEWKSCKQLDFLPFQCDACHHTYCLEHRQYDNHDCAKGKKRDNQAFFCPECNASINVGFDGDVDEKLAIHFANECTSSGFAPKVEKKKTGGRCVAKGCRKKELMPVTCKVCRQNVCLDHRFESDHDCPGPNGKKKATTPAPKASHAQTPARPQNTYGTSRDCREPARSANRLGCSNSECEVQ